MPKYTLTHGGLTLPIPQKDGTVKGKHFPHGSEVELSVEEAEKLNARGSDERPILKLSALVAAEKKAEEASKDLIAKAKKDLDAALLAEKKKAEDTVKPKGGAK